MPTTAPDTEKWEKVTPIGPPWPQKAGRGMGYFYPENNVLVFHADLSTPWAYRYKRKAR